MRSPSISLGLYALLIAQVASVVALPPSLPDGWKRATPVPPTSDPFYSPPSGYESAAPGTILRSRNVPAALEILNLFPVKVAGAYQLQYRTTDSLGNPEAAVTTVIVPQNANMSRLLSYQVAEDSAWANCAPSYSLQQGSLTINNGNTAPAEFLLIIAALNQGWVVNVPDYEGPQAAFTSGIQAGQATLDSVRAALASGTVTGVSPSAQHQLWGYSGGSLASEWAAELQPTYAPELNFAGAALGGIIPNISSVLLTINEGFFAGLAPTGILGLASAYPDLQTFIGQHIVESTASEIEKVLSQCFYADLAQFAFQDLFSYTTGGVGLLDDPIPAKIISETGIMGVHGTPKMPLLVYKATGDEVSVVADSDALVQKLCSQGANIQYVRDSFGEHITEAITGAGDALVFLKDRFDGVPLQSGCSTQDVFFDAFSVPAAEALGSVLVDALLAILELPIGEMYVF